MLRFCEVARHVFQARPARLFLHGFHIRSLTIELWMFDRSGAYSSSEMDLAQQPELLAKLLASYTMMSDEEVGFNPLIRRDGFGSYVALTNTDEDGKDRLYLYETPIAAPEYLIGPGTTCYTAKVQGSKTPEFVVKFAWREDTIHTERELLELTKAQNVWGVIKASAYQDINAMGAFATGTPVPSTIRIPTGTCRQRGRL